MLLLGNNPASAQFAGARQQAQQIRGAIEGTPPDDQGGRQKHDADGGKVVLFNATDLEGWATREAEAQNHWKVVAKVEIDSKDGKKLTGSGKAGSPGCAMLLAAATSGADIRSDATFGDVELHVEFMIPKTSNSGIYLMGQYEVQIFDSFGKKKDDLTAADLGGIYDTRAPSQNAAKPPGAWQTFDILFRAPRFDKDNKKTENARFVSVKLNGTQIQKETEVKGPTGSELPGGEKAKGPLMFQGNHGAVAFRNVWVRPVEGMK